MIEPDDDETSHTTQRAIDGDRVASAFMWEQVAQGNFDKETRMWLRHVAEGVLDAESKSAGALRDRAIVRAVGLEGREDKHRALREWVSALRAFGATRKEMVQQLDDGRTGVPELEVYRGTPPHELGKLIDRENQKDQPEN